VNVMPTLTLLLAVPLAAQAPVGTWTLASAPDITAAIEKGTEAMNFIKRPIARSRLKKTNAAYQRIKIERAGTEYVVTYDQRAPQHMPADGRGVNWKREDGESFLISMRVDREDMIQDYKAEDGERINVFHVDPATRTLTMAVTIKSQKLPGPITYTVAYKAAN